MSRSAATKDRLIFAATTYPWAFRFNRLFTAPMLKIDELAGKSGLNKVDCRSGLGRAIVPADCGIQLVRQRQIRLTLDSPKN
jgi:hypothetical protein